ncbi:MAG: DUF2794 domain-containing protein [Alphaproteobacteria bacterium]|nr:DUF2794 domain-containing protein [Alphaproteobacteria bacterium]
MGSVVSLEDIRRRGPGSASRKGPRSQKTTYFTRVELQQLLALYGARVATGEWRDYAMDHGPGFALFSIFRHSFDRPLFTVAKIVGAGSKRPVWFEAFSGPRSLKRARSLAEALAAIDKPSFTLVS